MHWDGSVWISASLPGFEPHSIWGASRDNVWAAGNGLFHWNGSAWSNLQNIPTARVVWGSAPTDVWEIGGNVEHWDGMAWSPASFPVSGGTIALVGFSSDDFWAAGEGLTSGFVDHWEGTTWRPSFTGMSSLIFYSLWGTGSRDIWAVGICSRGTGCAYHWDGLMWTEYLLDGTAALQGVWGAVQ